MVALTRRGTRHGLRHSRGDRGLSRELDAFIEREIRPLEREDDNIRFFDHRREHARTDLDNGGLPRHEWEELLGRDAAPRRRGRATCASACPRSYGGKDGSNLAMAIIREHLAHKGLGLHNDLQNESSIVGNFPTVLMLQRLRHRGAEGRVDRRACSTAPSGSRFGLTEPNHGSDATFMETTAVATATSG